MAADFYLDDITHGLKVIGILTLQIALTDTHTEIPWALRPDVVIE